MMFFMVARTRTVHWPRLRTVVSTSRSIDGGSTVASNLERLHVWPDLLAEDKLHGVSVLALGVTLASTLAKRPVLSSASRSLEVILAHLVTLTR